MSEKPDGDFVEPRPDADAPGGRQQRRRRGPEPDATSEPSAAEQVHEDVPSAAEQPRDATPRRRALVPAEPEAKAPSDAEAVSAPVAKEPAPAAAIPAAPAEAAPVARRRTLEPQSSPAVQEGEDANAKKVKDTKEGGDGISSGRRTLRIVLLLFLIIAAAGVVFILLEGMDQGGGRMVANTIPTFEPLTPNPDGDALADTLFRQLAAGEYAMVRDKRDSYVAMTPRHSGVLRAVYLADAVDVVKKSFAELMDMPRAESDDGSFLAVEERLNRIVPRMVMLNRMDEYRQDWGDTLLDLPGIKEIYDTTREETFLANRRVAEWRRYQAAFEVAYGEMNANIPPYEQVAAALASQETVLPSNGVKRVCDNIIGLRDAANGVAVNDMRAANDALSTIAVRPYEQPAVNIEDRLEALVERQRDGIAAQFASWRYLWEQSERAGELYTQGKMKDAIAEIDLVLAGATPDSVASQTLYDELGVKRERWSGILDAYDRAVKDDAESAIPERMVAWQSFASMLDPNVDVWQVTAALSGANRIRDELNAWLGDLYDKHSGDWDSYEEITSKIRQPSTPREEFTARADTLRSLSIAADEILKVRSMAFGVELNEKSRMAVSMARQILAEQGGQAQSLWNLGRLYRDRGEITRFRECLERVILLGDNASNPFYVEARTVLEETSNAQNAGD